MARGNLKFCIIASVKHVPISNTILQHNVPTTRQFFVNQFPHLQPCWKHIDTSTFHSVSDVLVTMLGTRPCILVEERDPTTFV